MAEGRKIPYWIELGAKDDKLRRQMAQFDWEKITGIKGLSKHFEKPAKEASDAIENAFANTTIDWDKALQTDAFKSAVSKIVQHANAELREGLLGKDEAKNVTEFIAEIGNAWKEIGVAMDSKGFARSMAAFAKSVEPLGGQIDKLTAAFGVFSDKISSDTAKVAGRFTVIGDAAGKATIQVNKSIETMEAKLASIDKMLSEDYGKKFKFDTDLETQFYDIDEAIENVERNIEQLSKEFNNMSSSDKDFDKTRNQLVQLYTEQVELYRKLELVDKEYTRKYSKDASLLRFNAIDPKSVIGEARETIETIIHDAKLQLKDISTSTKTTKDGINIPIKLPSQAELVKTINNYVKSINDSDAIHGVRLKLDNEWLNDSANVIQDQARRAYGDNPADEDAATTSLIKKTDDRFIKIAQTIGKKQKGILNNTKKWRSEMIKAMQIGKDDLNFQFGWDSHLKESADSLFNKLQEYFEQPEYALDIKFNTEKIARDLKASIEAEGIELGVTGGTANIDAKNFMSMLHSVLYGGMPVRTAAQTSGTSGNSTQKEVADETDDAVDSSKEYVKVLDETTLHIDKVIESLRMFAKEATKAKASKGSKAIANKLLGMGIDVSQIKKETSDAQILKMIQEGTVHIKKDQDGNEIEHRRHSIMTKDEMGKPQGSSLVGEIRALMSANGMDAKKGAGKVAEILAQDIMELFNINEIETELETQVEKRFKQLNLWRGVEKPGRALAALGNVRSTKNKVRLPEMQAIDDAINYFEDAGEDTDALKKLQEARKKFEDSGQTDEAKAEFEKAALVFYEETKDVFRRLKARWGDFKGTVSAEGRKPILINPKGAYPTRILEIPKDAVITKVEPFEAFEVVDNVGHVGSSARRESSVKKAEQEQKRLNYGTSGYDFLTSKPHPKKDIRYEDIEYDTFKTQESGRLPQDVALDATIESLEKRVTEIPELVKRIEESKKNIAQLDEIKQQIKDEIENLKVQDLPEFQTKAFEQYSNRNGLINKILLNSSDALDNNGILDTGDISKLDNEQQYLVNRLKAITTNIHNDSEASQELANKIAEIVEAKKLSKEELELARSNAAQRGDQARVDLYRDLLFNRESVDSRLESYQSQKGVVDENVGKNKDYAKKLIAQLSTARSQNADKATKEAEVLAAKLIEVKERLYAEAKTYAEILNDSSVDDKTREIALGKLQGTLGALNQISGQFANIQPYVLQTSLYNSSQQNNIDKWNKNYTKKEVNRLEEELKTLENQLKEEDDEAKVVELKKKIANTKRKITRLKKIVPDNVSSQKQTELVNIERQLGEEQSKLTADENRKMAADRASGDLQSIKQDSAFLTQYNELLEKEKLLLEEVNKLKREGADKSVIEGKTEELKQATKALDNFLKKEKTAERTAYAREQAVEYQAQLHTAYRKRSAFDSQIQELDDDEANLTKYGLSGRVGSRARRRALSTATAEYMSSDEVRAQEEAIRKNEQLSWEQRDKQLKELRQKLREEFAKKFDDTNVMQDELDRIAAERAIAEGGREPLDKIIKDLQSQKKTAMRYGAVSEDDLKNDKYLKQNEQYNKNILKLTDDRVKVEQELERIKSDDSLDEKKQEKEIKSKQKEIDAINQEIQRNQDLIDNRVKLMELHKQEKEESKQTPEEKALLATEKLVGLKQSLTQAEEKVAARQVDYESAKGTENEIKMLEALDSQIRKRDQIQEQIENTEKKIERLGQVVQKTEGVQGDTGEVEVASTVEGTTSVDGGLVGLIKEVVGEASASSIDLTKVEDILSKILAVLSGNGVVGSTRNSEMDAKLARIRELEAKQQLANEQKKTAETAKQVENAKKETTSQTSDTSDDSRKLAVKQVNAYDKDKVAQWSSMSDDELISTMKSLMGDMDGLSKETIEYIQKQRELGRILNAYKEKSASKDEATAKNGYVNPKILAQKDPKLAELGLYDNHTPITSDRAVREMFGVTDAQKKTKAKQEEAKAEEKITEEKKEQERVRFTRKEKKELNRLKGEVKDYNPDATTGTGSEFGGFATENTLRAILEVLNKISTSGVPKSSGKSSNTGGAGTRQNDYGQDDGEMTELERRVGDLKGKFKDAISVGYLDKNNADLAAFNKQLDDIEKSDGTVEQLEEMRKKALALGDVVSKTVAKNKRMYSGTTEINAATRQRTNMEARGALNNADLEMVEKYNNAYDELIAKHKEFAVAGTLYDPENQKTLQNMAIKVKDLGKQLEKSAAEAEQLQQLVDNSGVYNGQSLGSTEHVGKIDDGTFEVLAKKRLQELGAEHIKFDKIHKRAIGTKRLDNRTVAELEVKYNDLAQAMFTYQKAEKESLTGVPAFLNGFKKKFNSIMQYLSMTMSIHQVMAELRKGVQYVREIDLALTELKKVTDETEETYDEFLQTAAKTGARLGSTISAVTEATATFAKLGYSMEQATEMAEAAIVYKNVGDNIASTEDAADSIISTMKGFKLEATESMAIVDRFNEVKFLPPYTVMYMTKMAISEKF